MANPSPFNYADIGNIGEDLVAKWLQSTGWEILHRRFWCRWGEIDIIAQKTLRYSISGNQINRKSTVSIK